MVRIFSDNPSLEGRALQIYQILICKAHNRQLTTYGEIAHLIGYGGSGVLDRQLGIIMTYCDRNGLPPLTILVVNDETGSPGTGLTTFEDENADRRKVFKFSWYDLIPPTIEELATYREG